ncbi:MAG: transposase [Pirellulales bacterium]
MAARRIVDDELYAHFVTFSCHRRRRLLDLNHPKRIVLGVLSQELQRTKGKCIGFVVMPDHVHALIWFSRPGCLSRFMHEWKRYSSRLIRQWYR